MEKCITIPFISEALEWCCGEGCKFIKAGEGFLLMSNVYTRRKFNRKVCEKETSTSYICLIKVLNLYQCSRKYGNIKTWKMKEKSYKIKVFKKCCKSETGLDWFQCILLNDCMILPQQLCWECKHFICILVQLLTFYLIFSIFPYSFIYFLNFPTISF